MKTARDLIKEANIKSRHWKGRSGIDDPPKFTNPIRNMFLTGDVGVGKSWRAAELLGEAIKAYNASIDSWAIMKGKDFFKFYSCPKFLREARFDYRLVTEATTRKGIVLDDLGAHINADWTLDIIYTVINERLEKHLPTIVTSNVDLADIAKIDERLASRLATYEYYKMEGEE